MRDLHEPTVICCTFACAPAGNPPLALPLVIKGAVNLQRDLILAATAAAVFLRLGKLVEAAEIVAGKESLRKRSTHLVMRDLRSCSLAQPDFDRAGSRARRRLDHALQLCDQGKQCCDASGTKRAISGTGYLQCATILLDMDRPARPWTHANKCHANAEFARRGAVSARQARKMPRSLVEMSQSAKNNRCGEARNNMLEKMGEGHAALQAERTALRRAALMR